MRYSISQVAKASGVSARVLRHYDAIGLLRPQSVAANGYRWYGRAELLRLQRILVLRRLGLGLAAIGDLVHADADEAAALRAHLAGLRAERRRLDELIDTVAATVADLGTARITDPERFFAGLKRDTADMRAAYTEHFGDGAAIAFDEAEAAVAGFEADDFEHAAAQSAKLFRELAAVMRAGVAPEHPAALDAVAAHHAAIRLHWTPTADAYAALGALYRTDPRQRAIAAQADPELPEWLADAMAAYARLRLGASDLGQ